MFSRFEGYQVQGDESFFVHDIDTTANANKIYYRQFVSPTATIKGFKGTRVIIVDINKKDWFYNAINKADYLIKKPLNYKFEI